MNVYELNVTRTTVESVTIHIEAGNRFEAEEKYCQLIEEGKLDDKFNLRGEIQSVEFDYKNHMKRIDSKAIPNS